MYQDFSYFLTWKFRKINKKLPQQHSDYMSRYENYLKTRLILNYVIHLKIMKIDSQPLKEKTVINDNFESVELKLWTASN